MAEIEKTKKGLECCQISMHDEEPFEKCQECPYNEISVYVQECRSALCMDALELISALENQNKILLLSVKLKEDKREMIHIHSEEIDRWDVKRDG